MDKLVIYTDGGCRGNPGPGAWAFTSSDGKVGSNGKTATTNNEMELTAIFEAIKYINSLGYIKECDILSDSTYAINTLTLWADNWIKRGDIMGRPNCKLILDIKTEMNTAKVNGIKLNFIKVKGHSGVDGNEQADYIVNRTLDNMMKVL